jgi:hypothetical protein
LISLAKHILERVRRAAEENRRAGDWVTIAEVPSFLGDGELTGKEPASVQERQSEGAGAEPKALKFEVTQLPLGDFVKISWKDDSLEYESTIQDYEIKHERLSFTPTHEAWADFWSKCDALGIWTWQEKYPSGGMDGTEWSLELTHGGRTVRSFGANAYPPHGLVEPSEEFESFCSYLSSLVGGKPIDAV